MRPGRATGTAALFAAGLTALVALDRALWTTAAALPFVNSLALVVTMPRARAARALPVVACHVATAAIGLSFAALAGPSLPTGIAAATLAIALMAATGVSHPPATLTAVAFASGAGAQPSALPGIVAGALTAALVGVAARRLDLAPRRDPC